MTKKQKRVRRSEAPVRWFLKQHGHWVRRVSVVLGLALVAVALWFIVDPLQGPTTAITESGEEIEVGVIDRPGAFARTGSPAPDFVLPDYDQRAVYLNQFEGKVVFVNFWASWCTFCEQEMPDIIDVAERYPDDLVVLAVNRGESKGTAKGWSDGHNFPDLANVYWVLDEREDVADEYRVRGMPQSFFVDRAGNVYQELRRVTEYEELRRTMELLVGGSARGTAGG